MIINITLVQVSIGLKQLRQATQTPEIMNWFHEYVAGVSVEYKNKPDDKESVSGRPHDWKTPGEEAKANITPDAVSDAPGQTILVIDSSLLIISLVDPVGLAKQAEKFDAKSEGANHRFQTFGDVNLS